MVGFGLSVQGDHGKRISRVYLYRPEDRTGARSCGCRLCDTQLIIGMDLDGEAHGFLLFVDRSPLIKFIAVTLKEIQNM